MISACHIDILGISRPPRRKRLLRCTLHRGNGGVSGCDDDFLSCHLLLPSLSPLLMFGHAGSEILSELLLAPDPHALLHCFIDLAKTVRHVPS